MQSAVTFDVDWAPDWCIELCAELCHAQSIPATFFCTHETDVLERLRDYGLFELGIHPSLGPGSTHGNSEREILDHCLSIVPEARSMRTHGLVQSTALYRTVSLECPSILYDVSLFLPDHTNLQVTTLHFGEGKSIHRLPYFWEDDIASVAPEWDWSNPVPRTAGLRIFDFHPIHVALNMSSFRQYVSLKESLGGRPLHSLSPADLRPFSNDGEGVRTFLERVLDHAESSEFGTICQVAEWTLSRESDECG